MKMLTLNQALAPCHKKRAAHDSGARPKSALKWIVLHDTEGGTASSVATMFSRPSAEASTQLVVDDFSCYRMLPDLVIPWGAPGGNTNGLHIEQCGFARWSREQWLSHPHTLQRSAAKAARWAHMYGIPLRWVGPLGLRLGRKGVTTHAAISKWQRTPGGHTDPGPNFPKDIWMLWAKLYLAGLEGL